MPKFNFSVTCCCLTCCMEMLTVTLKSAKKKFLLSFKFATEVIFLKDKNEEKLHLFGFFLCQSKKIISPNLGV